MVSEQAIRGISSKRIVGATHGGSSCGWHPDLYSGGVYRGGARHLFDETPSHREAITGDVLRVTVSHVLYPVTEGVLHQVFDSYGAEQVVVLERADHVEALVRFRSSRDAKRARDVTHGRCVYDSCCWLDVQYMQSTPSDSIVATPVTCSTLGLSHNTDVSTAATTSAATTLTTSTTSAAATTTSLVTEAQEAPRDELKELAPDETSEEPKKTVQEMCEKILATLNSMIKGSRDINLDTTSNVVEAAGHNVVSLPAPPATVELSDITVQSGYSYDGSTADVSADQYHHYMEDVKLMHEMGLDAYRFSLSWPRLIPDGRGQINPKGLEYYNNLIDELILHGIQPHATINHFDLPQVLQDEYGGLLSPRFIEDYTAYAEVCFKNFGDRVKHWVTINEPNIEPIGGYDIGSEPPRRCSYPFGTNCTRGNSSTEPYIAAHHLLLAHASAVSLYREKYKASQGDQIGITLLGWWHEPATNTLQDAAAAMRMNDFHLGWFMHPLVYGDYPPVMRNRVGARLPPLTVEESEKVRGSFDFIGFNHYLIVRIRSIEANFSQKLGDYYVDAAVENPLEDIAKGKVETAPWSLGKLLEHLKLNYRNPPVLIHENGYGDTPDTASKIEYDDDNRSKFLQDYLEVLYLSIRNGSNARGYFVWSFLDVFEFLYGYQLRFGLCGIDMSTEERTRYVRNSARWYSGFLNGGELRPVDPSEKSYVE